MCLELGHVYATGANFDGRLPLPGMKTVPTFTRVPVPTLHPIKTIGYLGNQLVLVDGAEGRMDGVSLSHHPPRQTGTRHTSIPKGSGAQT